MCHVPHNPCMYKMRDLVAPGITDSLFCCFGAGLAGQEVLHETCRLVQHISLYIAIGRPYATHEGMRSPHAMAHLQACEWHQESKTFGPVYEGLSNLSIELASAGAQGQNNPQDAACLRRPASLGYPKGVCCCQQSVGWTSAALRATALLHLRLISAPHLWQP